LILELSLTVAGAIVAAWALLRARRVARRLDRLTDSYWELRYEYGQLRARVSRLEGGSESEQPAAGSEPAAGSFIPLSSLKR
jgi:hypothetical protein